MKDDIILLAHGNGGIHMQRLIHKMTQEIFNPGEVQLDDSAILNLPADSLAFTTDSYIISPIFFNGGDIGSLAVNGTVNDLSVMGARPLVISCALILEEGLPMADLEKVLRSMSQAARQAGVLIVTGDTKVVEKGKGDKIFINTAGIGVFERPPLRQPVQAGDQIIINGSVGDHGVAILAQRNGLSFAGEFSSDCAPLNTLIERIAEKHHSSIRFIRDATRGGVASVLNEIVSGKPVGIQLREPAIPVKEEVRSTCELLGMDPLYLANEGKLIMVVDPVIVKSVLDIMHGLPGGRNAACIGEISRQFPGQVSIQTELGGFRLLPLLSEDQLPRIC